MTTAQSDLLADAPAVEPRLHVTTPMVRDLLRKRYAAPEWAFMEEVAPKTGGGTRYADGVAVNLWTSRGHAVHGFEIKVTRSDWLRELKDPSKAEPVFRYCDHWFIVAPRGVVHEHELPPTWGLLEVRAAGLVVSKAAPKLEPQPVSRAFFASMMRRGFELLDAHAERKVTEVRAQARQELSDELKRREKDSTRELDDLKRRLAEFEAASGVTIDRYRGPPAEMLALAKRLQGLQGYRNGGGLGALEDLAQQLQRSSEAVLKALGDCNMLKSAGTDGG
jgi:hypothetical protein